MFKSIKTKLTVSILSILLIVFTIQMAANFMFAERYYINKEMKIIEKVYEKISHSAVSNSDKSIIEVVQENKVNNLQFLVANEQLKCIYNSKKSAYTKNESSTIKSNFNFKKKIHLFHKDAKPVLIDKSNNNKDRIQLYGIIERKDTCYYIVIRVSFEGIQEDMRDMNMFILYIASFALVAGGLLVYSIAKKVAKPIEEINQVSIHVSNLDFSHKASEDMSQDEINSLAKNINSMSNKLEESINELTEANKKLEKDNQYMLQVDEIRKEFIANISHELKTPLAVLTGYAEMLYNDVDGIDKNFYYKTILDETIKMNILINKMMSLTSMENQLEKIDFEEINLSRFILCIVQKCEVLFQKKHIKVECDFTKKCQVRGDRFYLEQVIMNYINNAIQHTEEGKQIIIKVYKKEEKSIVSIYNEGKNIDPRDLDKIWDNFYRADKARTRTDNNNIGLGLYLVRTIMNAHHGHYGVNNLPKGVEFWISL